MPDYNYLCDCGIIEDRHYPIGTAERMTTCTTCGGTMRLVIGAGVQIAPSALESKGVAVRNSEATERRWDKDMPAYKRMRDAGLQPRGIDGCSRLENEVGDQLDVNHKALLDTGVSRDRLIEGTEQAREIMETGATA